MQDLVGVGVADARQQRLFDQRGFDPLGARAEDLRELVFGDLERVGAEPADARHPLWVLDDVDREPFLGAGLGEVEGGCRALGGEEMHPQRQRALPGLGRGGAGVVGPAQPSAAREMGDQPDAAAIEAEEFAPPARAGDVATGQRRHGWVEGLDRAQRRDVHASDHRADGMFSQELRQRLHFR